MIGGSVAGTSRVGGLVGYNAGTIAGAYTTGAINGGNNVGGLVGESQGAISGSHAAGIVTEPSSGTDIGGLVGHNEGMVGESDATGSVIDASSVTQPPSANVGGLVGYNTGPITNSYATGATFMWHNGTAVGGLVGFNSGVLANVYSTSYVGASNGTDVAGLVGNNQGKVINGYWNRDTSGQPTGVGPDSAANGAVGLSASRASPFQSASYAGFDFPNSRIWNIVPGLSFPYLLFQFPGGTPQVISGMAFRAPLVGPGVNNGQPQLLAYTVGAVVDGVRMGLTTLGQNGFYDFLIPPGTISPTGSRVIAYSTGYPSGNSFYDHATGSVTGLNIYGHYLTLNSGASTVTGIAKDLAKALGSQTGNEFIFTVGSGPRHMLKLMPDPSCVPACLPGGPMLVINSSSTHLN